MNHFSASQWLEFARHTLSSEQKALMQGHLDEGCDKCQRLSEMWKEVLEISRRDSNYRPPADAIRAAEAVFAPADAWRWLREMAQAARLIFDSAREPAPAAIRGSKSFSRQILQESKPFMVDLRLECEPARKWVRLTGQVLNSKEPDKSVTDVQVFLLKGEHLAMKSEANSSGEFDLEFKDEEGLQLFIDVPGKQVIEIRLPASLTEGHGIAGGAE